MASIDALLDRRHKVLGAHAPLFYDCPLHLVRADGVWVYDADGRRYLDAYNNVPHVGHCHPRVVEALRCQAATLNIHTRYLDEHIVAYAERLLSHFDYSLSRVMFCCTGSEANELALRIVRECTGGTGVITTAYSYHGNTAAVSQVSSLFTRPEKHGANVRFIPVMDPYRDRQDSSDEQLARRYAEEVRGAIESFAAAGLRFAGLLFCTCFSTEGLPMVPRDFMPQALQHVHAAGGLFIADEVQGGFGRLGTHMWGHQRLGVVPDLVTLGKPMGNGHPLAAVVTRPELGDRFTRENVYFNTFGGNPVSAQVGMAVLQVLEEEGLMAHAREVGEYTLRRLRRLAARHALIGDVRGSGLFFGVELVRDRERKIPAPQETQRLVNKMRDHGVLLSRIGPHSNVLKIRPPLVFSREHADLLADTLDRVLTAL